MVTENSSLLDCHHWCHPIKPMHPYCWHSELNESLHLGVCVCVYLDLYVFFVRPFFVKEFPRFDRLISANLG